MDASKATPAGDSSRDCWGPLLELAVREVFDQMLRSRVRPMQGPCAADQFDTTAMIGLTGQVSGMMTLRCSAKAAILMSSKMLGVNISDAEPHMYDALGEICNMIAGGFKSRLGGIRDSTTVSLPRVTGGADFAALAPAGRIQVNLLFEGFPFSVSIEPQS
jgi:chemotaxis protein CheX